LQREVERAVGHRGDAQPVHAQLACAARGVGVAAVGLERGRLLGSREAAGAQRENAHGGERCDLHGISALGGGSSLSLASQLGATDAGGFIGSLPSQTHHMAVSRSSAKFGSGKSKNAGSLASIVGSLRSRKKCPLTASSSWWHFPGES